MGHTNGFEDLFAKEDSPSETPKPGIFPNDAPLVSWKILVVDDEVDMHMITKLALNHFEYKNHALEILSAFSAAEAREILRKHPDIAMVFLDVVMETHDAGFNLVNYIRDDLNNQNIRIVMRTGQPGNETEQELLRRYRIDDYKTKTELTSDKLFATAMTSLKTYDALMGREKQQQKLEKTVEEQNSLLQAINRDLMDEIRKREKTEKKLKNSEQRFRMLYENLDITLKSITEGVIRTDDTGRVLLMNKMAETLTGWKFEAPGTLHINEIFTISRKPKSPLTTPLESGSDITSEPESVAKDASTSVSDMALKSMSNVTSAPTPSTHQTPSTSTVQEPTSESRLLDAVWDSSLETEYHTILTAKDGSRRIIEYRRSPIKNDMEIILGNAIIFRDITEKVQLENQLIRAQRMESLGTLAGGIAHDFNNILASILGFTELLLYDAAKESQLEEYLMEIFTAGTRAKELVKQILTFARHSRHSLQPVQIHLIAKETLKLIRSSIPATIAIDADIQSTALAMVDPTQIHQIFMNLFTNAAHAMEDHGGRLTVRIRDKKIPSRTTNAPIALEPGDYIEITLADTGTGIPPEIIPSIFEPYFTTKKHGEGTGMGLALVHGIIESYKGNITVKSQVGKGTVFTLHIPAAKEFSISETPSIRQDFPTATGNILLVDDEVAILKMGKLLLQRSGFHVTSTTSSTDALNIFTSKPGAFDLVITDMTMPHMTGDLLAEKMRQIRPDIPMIVCTGYTKKLSKKKALSIGFNAYITKPFSKDALITTVQKLLNPEET